MEIESSPPEGNWLCEGAKAVLCGTQRLLAICINALPAFPYSGTWASQQETAKSCIGVVLQVGQFIGTRADFIPEPICKMLSLLQDKVRPTLCLGSDLICPLR